MSLILALFLSQLSNDTWVQGGHKEMSIEEKERREAKSTWEGGSASDLLQNRVLSHDQVSRAGKCAVKLCKEHADCYWAALFDKSDVQQIAGSKQSLDVSRLDAVRSIACSYHAL